jgi:hypothetical protein
MEMYWPRVQFLASLTEMASQDTIYFLTLGGCPPMPDVTDAQHPYCAGFVDAAKAIVQEKNIKTVVFGANWWSYLASTTPYRYRGLKMSLPAGRNAAIGDTGDMMRFDGVQWPQGLCDPEHTLWKCYGPEQYDSSTPDIVRCQSWSCGSLDLK